MQCMYVSLDDFDKGQRWWNTHWFQCHCLVWNWPIICCLDIGCTSTSGIRFAMEKNKENSSRWISCVATSFGSKVPCGQRRDVVVFFWGGSEQNTIDLHTHQSMNLKKKTWNLYVDIYQLSKLPTKKWDLFPLQKNGLGPCLKQKDLKVPSIIALAADDHIVPPIIFIQGFFRFTERNKNILKQIEAGWEYRYMFKKKKNFETQFLLVPFDLGCWWCLFFISGSQKFGQLGPVHLCSTLVGAWVSWHGGLWCFLIHQLLVPYYKQFISVPDLSDFWFFVDLIILMWLLLVLIWTSNNVGTVELLNIPVAVETCFFFR